MTRYLVLRVGQTVPVVIAALLAAFLLLKVVPGDPARAIAAMRIPLDFLKFEIDFGSQSGANVTMIRNTPDRQYLSVAELSGSVPDFHQPEQFPPMTYVPILQKPSPGYPNLAP